jgi:glutamate synthase domain-containing protein 1
MKKFWIWFLSIVGVIILAVIMVYIFTSVILGHILTSSFGTKTTIDNSAITLKSLRIWDLHVKNPPHTKYPYALTIERIKVKAPISTYFTKFIQIEKIVLDDLTLIVEILPGRQKWTNWDAIMKHINDSSKDQKPSTREALIKQLTVNNLTVNMVNANGEVKTTKIKNITFKNLNTKKGNITSQIAKAIVFKMIFTPENIMHFPMQYSKDSFNELLNNFRKSTNTKSK